MTAPTTAATLRPIFFSAFATRHRPADDDLLVVAPSHPELGPLHALLQSCSPEQLGSEDVRTAVEGQLWAVRPAAFLHFLPAFMALVLQHHDRLAAFSAELVDALTAPQREDIAASLQRLAAGPAGSAPAAPTVPTPAQIDWFDTGAPALRFRERFADVAPAEGRAIRLFLDTLQHLHGADFPFDEPGTAVARTWWRYSGEPPAPT